MAPQAQVAEDDNEGYLLVTVWFGDDLLYTDNARLFLKAIVGPEPLVGWPSSHSTLAATVSCALRDVSRHWPEGSNSLNLSRSCCRYRTRELKGMTTGTLTEHDSSSSKMLLFYGRLKRSCDRIGEGGVPLRRLFSKQGQGRGIRRQGSRWYVYIVRCLPLCLCGQPHVLRGSTTGPTRAPSARTCDKATCYQQAGTRTTWRRRRESARLE